MKLQRARVKVVGLMFYADGLWMVGLWWWVITRTVRPRRACALCGKPLLHEVDDPNAVDAWLCRRCEVEMELGA